MNLTYNKEDSVLIPLIIVYVIIVGAYSFFTKEPEAKEPFRVEMEESKNVLRLYDRQNGVVCYHYGGISCVKVH